MEPSHTIPDSTLVVRNGVLNRKTHGIHTVYYNKPLTSHAVSTGSAKLCVCMRMSVYVYMYVATVLLVMSVKLLITKNNHVFKVGILYTAWDSASPTIGCSYPACMHGFILCVCTVKPIKIPSTASDDIIVSLL